MEGSELSAIHIIRIASFPGPAQLFVTCCMEKQGEPGIFFSREHEIIDKKNSE